MKNSVGHCKRYGLRFDDTRLPSLAWHKRRAFGFFRRHRQPGVGSDPIDSIFLGGKFSKVVHGTIRPYYLHAPDVAFAHRQ